MSEDDEARDGAGAPPDARARLGRDFMPRLASGVAMGAVAALCTFTGALPFAVLVVAVAVLLSWEWARLVHGRLPRVGDAFGNGQRLLHVQPANPA